jgi:hypothetical protein
MRTEEPNSKRRVQPIRDSFRLCDNGLMTPMQPVKITERNDSAFILSR